MLHKAEIKTIYAAKIENAMNSIAGVEDMLKGNTQIDISEDKLNEMLKNYQTILEKLTVERDKLLKEEASFTFTETDKSFKKCVGKATRRAHRSSCVV